MSVTIHDLILLAGAGVDVDSLGEVFSFDADPAQSDLLDVLDDVSFERPDGAIGEIIPLGSTTTISGQEYELTEIYSFWGTYTKIDRDTGEEFVVSGQTMGLTLTAPDGSQLSFLVPSDQFVNSPEWQSGTHIQSIEVASDPTVEPAIHEKDDGTSKLGDDDDITIPCFVAGTLIDTADGPKAVEAIKPGDLILTRDHGYMPVVWAGARHLDADELAQNPHYRAIIIRAGALGNGLPQRDLRVSPWHRVLFTGPRAELLFGEYEVLIPAIYLLGQAGVERDQADVTYLHIMFDTHQIIRSEGAWSESFQPGQKSLGGMDDEQREELFALFPELRSMEGRDSYVAARLTLKQAETRALLVA